MEEGLTGRVEAPDDDEEREEIVGSDVHGQGSGMTRFVDISTATLPGTLKERGGESRLAEQCGKWVTQLPGRYMYCVMGS